MSPYASPPNMEKASYPRAAASGVRSGRLTQEEMCELFKEEEPAVVLDATHPYATEVTANIKAAVRSATVPEYVRVVREKDSGGLGSGRYCKDIPEAVEYLNSTEGNILLTTGSKELASYCGIRDRQNRVFARVLPLTKVVEQVEGLGYKGSHLICMQGPFSEEMNLAMINHAGYKISCHERHLERARIAAEAGGGREGRHRSGDYRKT